MAHESGYEQIESVALDEIDDGRNGMTDHNVGRELDPVVLRLGERLFHDGGEFAIRELFIANDLFAPRE